MFWCKNTQGCLTIQSISPRWITGHSVKLNQINFFFLPLYFFHWRIIALQNLCFSVVHQQELAIDTPMSAPSRTSLPSPSHPTLLDCHRAPVWVPWAIQQIPIGYLFYIWSCKFPCYFLHTDVCKITHLPPRHPPPTPAMSIGLFSMSVSPLLPWKLIPKCHLFRFHIYASV